MRTLYPPVVTARFWRGVGIGLIISLGFWAWLAWSVLYLLSR